MFEAHFQFQRTPFARECPPDGIYRSRAHQEAFRRLLYVAEHRQVLLLTGEAGAGKSTALRALAGELDPTAYRVLYLADVAFTPRSFFTALLEGLQQEAPFHMAKAKSLARQGLLGSQTTHRRTPVLLVDEAQNLSPAVLEEIRGLRRPLRWCWPVPGSWPGAWPCSRSRPWCSGSTCAFTSAA